jgi:hypothetical protein
MGRKGGGAELNVPVTIAGIMTELSGREALPLG